MANQKDIINKIIQVTTRLYNRNMLAGVDGNVSYRLSDDEIIITPSLKATAFLKPEDFVTINIKGESDNGKPSSETSMHLAIYQNCPQAKTIVHAHPPLAVAWSVAHPELKELPKKCLTELILCAGTIPIVPMALPGSTQMGDVLKPYLPESRVMILARHGALSWGEDLDEAINGMERIEHAATILYHAKQLGNLSEISDGDYEKLVELRKKLGDKSL